MIRKPHRSSKAFFVLQGLHSIGGQADGPTWLQLIKWPGDRQPRRNDWDVMVHSLLSTGLIYKRGDVHIVTDEGLQYLGIPVDAPARPAPVIVGPRYVAPMRPLSTRHRPDLRMMREGALDYREIPSRHGEQAVAFKSSIASNVTAAGANKG